MVTDTQGAMSAPDEVLVSIVNSKPVAEVGPDQAVSVRGTTIHLDGRQSHDLEGDPRAFLDPAAKADAEYGRPRAS